MQERKKYLDEKIIYCQCPTCSSFRKKVGKRYNIIKRGHERNGYARFFCAVCGTWFNEKTGDSLRWLSR